MKSHIKKKKILPLPSRRFQKTRSPLRKMDGIEKWTIDSISSNPDMNGFQKQQKSNLESSGITSNERKSKRSKMIKKKV